DNLRAGRNENGFSPDRTGRPVGNWFFDNLRAGIVAEPSLKVEVRPKKELNDTQSDDESSMSETVLVVENSSKNESFSGESDEDTLSLRSDGEVFSDVETLEENESEVSEGVGIVAEPSLKVEVRLKKELDKTHQRNSEVFSQVKGLDFFPEENDSGYEVLIGNKDIRGTIGYLVGRLGSKAKIQKKRESLTKFLRSHDCFSALQKAREEGRVSLTVGGLKKIICEAGDNEEDKVRAVYNEIARAVKKAETLIDKIGADRVAEPSLKVEVHPKKELNDTQSDDESSMSETVLVVENSSKNESFSGESDEDTLSLRSDGEAFSDVETLEENESEVSEIAETEGEVAFAEMERTSDTTSNVLPERSSSKRARKRRKKTSWNNRIKRKLYRSNGKAKRWKK
ncbi:MAG: hypothetical protein J6T91_05305, partial [Alphaproteobacteria bacterium]|nr:hypothetical protein [Alphaproteobacteria bacterium]